MNKKMVGLCFVLMMSLLISCNSNTALINETNEVVVSTNNVEETDVAEVEEEVEEVIEVEVYVEPEDLDNPKLPATLTYIGRATMKIEFADETVVYIDPYAGTDADYETPADLVLVTHQHGDHNKVDKVTLKEEGQVVMCPTDLVTGDTIELYGLSITAVTAYNGNHPKAKGCGFLIEAGEMTLYHAGDTSYVPEMVELADEHIDFAFIPMDGVYNMGPVEAKLVADTILAEVIMPIHTDGELDWNQDNADKFSAENKIIILPGETLEIK
ncbi:MAG: MBL fold metallo-hydrolase [Clostridiales bacterium]|nr:MBL fold metallo-hydrolase [Clostridiales bacterium]